MVDSAKAPELQILGAAYGLSKVTDKVISLVDRNTQTLSVQASNDVFGDSWSGVDKTLIIVYRRGSTGAPRLSFTWEGQTAYIGAEDPGHFDYSYKEPPTLQILGAAYGPKDVTNILKGRITNEELNLDATNDVFGDSWCGVEKTLVVVAKYSTGNIFLDIVREQGKYQLKYRPPLAILGAVFGLGDVSSIVRASVSKRTLSIDATTSVFPDSWVGVDKSLSVVYQYGFEEPQLAIVTENTRLVIDYVPGQRQGPPPAGLAIVAATYGKADVTDKVRSRLASATEPKASFPANSDTFGDSWYGVPKSLVVFFRYGPTFVRTLFASENSILSIPRQNPHRGSAVQSLRGFLYTGDQIAVSSGSSFQFWKVGSDSQVRATEDSRSTASTFTLHARDDGGFALEPTSGVFLSVGQDGLIRADASPSDASTFYLFSQVGGGIILGTSRGFSRLGESRAVIADSKSYIGLDCSWEVTAIFPDEPPAEIQKMTAVSLDDCTGAFIKLVWDITGGFIIATGIIPAFTTGIIRPGFYAILRSNQRLWQRITGLLLAHKEVSVTVGLAALTAIYEEGMLGATFRFLCSTTKWIAITSIIAKALQFILIPEAEAAEMLASFAVWSHNTTMDVLEYANCKKTVEAC